MTTSNEQTRLKHVSMCSNVEIWRWSGILRQCGCQSAPLPRDGYVFFKSGVWQGKFILKFPVFQRLAFCALTLCKKCSLQRQHWCPPCQDQNLVCRLSLTHSQRHLISWAPPPSRSTSCLVSRRVHTVFLFLPSRSPPLAHHQCHDWLTSECSQLLLVHSGI